MHLQGLVACMLLLEYDIPYWWIYRSLIQAVTQCNRLCICLHISVIHIKHIKQNCDVVYKDWLVPGWRPSSPCTLISHDRISRNIADFSPVCRVLYLRLFIRCATYLTLWLWHSTMDRLCSNVLRPVHYTKGSEYSNLMRSLPNANMRKVFR